MPKAKLTDQEVREIRQSRDLPRVLVEKYSVSKSVITKIRLGYTYKGVDDMNRSK